jgi:hypothetical protein
MQPDFAASSRRHPARFARVRELTAKFGGVLISERGIYAASSLKAIGR